MSDSPMDDVSRAKIQAVRSNVKAMLAERQALRDPSAPPSSYWSDFCSAFDYMLELPESAFLKLRIHTYHFTAETYQTYYFGNADQFWAANHISELTEDIPPDLVINEPSGGIGFRYPSGRFISEDAVRFQKVINTLYRHGVLGRLRLEKSPLLLEIGAGYGGLAHHVREIVGGTYVIVDLPESLLFSAAYLTLQNLARRIYVYSPQDDSQAVLRDMQRGLYDFALFPNYRLHLLRPLTFDLVLNTASLQEMRSHQVEQYLDFIRDTCGGVFYSRNQDRQPQNQELASLNSLMRSRFAMTEVAEWKPSVKPPLRQRLRSAARSIAGLLGFLEPAQNIDANNPYRAFLCTPLSSRQSGQVRNAASV